MEIKTDELISAIRWRLGLPTDGDPGRFDQICERFLGSTDAGQQQLVTQICRFLGDAVEQAVRQRLNIPITGMTTVDDRAFLETLWQAIAAWIQADPIRRSPRVSGMLRDAVSSRKPSAPEPRRSVPAPPAPAANPRPAPARPVSVPATNTRPAPPPAPGRAAARAAPDPQPPR